MVIGRGLRAGKRVNDVERQIGVNSDRHSSHRKYIDFTQANRPSIVFIDAIIRWRVGMILRAVLAAFVSSLLAQSAFAEEPPQCGITKVADLPANTRGGRLLIDIKIDGADIWAQVD